MKLRGFEVGVGSLLHRCRVGKGAQRCECERNARYHQFEFRHYVASILWKENVEMSCWTGWDTNQRKKYERTSVKTIDEDAKVAMMPQI